MVTAVVLINVQRGQVNEVANRLAEIEGISEAYSVGGRYDLVAVIRTPSNDALAELVTGKIAAIEAISYTETLIAFETFSRHDLEAMFSIGN